jgi:DME family drug/metabolite transporter
MTVAVGAVRRGFLGISIAGLLWGTSGIVLQFVRESTDLGPLAISFYRMAIAALVLLMVKAGQIGALIAVIRAAPLRIAGIGAGVAAYQALYFVGVAWGGVAVATAVALGVAPVAIVIYEAVLLRSKPTGAALGGVTAAVTGLVLISGLGASPTGAAPRPLLGLVIAGLGGLSFAATTVLSRRMIRTADPLLLTTASTTVAAVVLLPVALAGGSFTLPAGLPVDGMLAYLGVIATALALSLFHLGLRTTPGGTAVVLTLVEPLAAALLAFAFLGERLSLTEILGVVLLVGAVVLTCWKG